MENFDLKYDFSTPEIRDRVWARVSASIDADETRQGFQVLDDEALEFLSAAGDLYVERKDNFYE